MPLKEVGVLYYEKILKDYEKAVKIKKIIESIDSDIKKQCESMYSELGLNLTTAINVFLRQSLRVGGFPFDVRLEKAYKETLEASEEAKRIVDDPNIKRYGDVEEALKALKE